MSGLKKINVGIGFTTDTGYRSEVTYSMGHGATAEQVIREASYELARIAELSGFGGAMLEETQKAIAAVKEYVGEEKSDA